MWREGHYSLYNKPKIISQHSELFWPTDVICFTEALCHPPSHLQLFSFHFSRPSELTDIHFRESPITQISR